MALVEQPVAIAIMLALRVETGLMILSGVRSSQTISTARRPQAAAMRLCSASGAGIEEAPGSVRPKPSAIDIMVEAVPIVMQVPYDRAIPPCTPSHCSLPMLPARLSSQYFQTSVPEPSFCPA